MSGEWTEEGRAPVVLDYEYHETRRLPVDVGIGITLSGSDIQIGAVEIKNAITDDRAVVTPAGDIQVTLDSEIVQVSGIVAFQPGVSVDTELPAATVLTDNQDQAVPVVGAYLMGLWDDDGDTEWRRARLLKYAQYDEEDKTQFDDSLITQSIIRGVNVAGHFDRIRGTADYGLEVDVTRLNTPITISGVLAVDATGQGDVPITLGGEIVQVSGVVLQGLHDNLNMNANLQVGDVDVSAKNRVPVDLDYGIPVLREPLDASSLGANERAAAVALEEVKTLYILLFATCPISGILTSTSGGSLLAGNLSLDALGAGFVLSPPADPSMHWFETAVGEALILELDSAIGVGGLLTYYTE